MHLVIYFCGTGDVVVNDKDEKDFPEALKRLRQAKNTNILLVEGCDNPAVCNSRFFPDLKGFAKRFTTQMVAKDGTWNHEDLETIGVDPSVSTIRGFEDTQIESITLCGYSRGAVTCFEVAKQLEKIAPSIPVDIVANQPVPGNVYQLPGSNAASVADCSQLKNIRNVAVILGAYTGALEITRAEEKVQVLLNMPEPEKLKKYKGRYLLINKQLYWVGKDGIAEEARFDSDCNQEEIFSEYQIEHDVEKSYTLPSGLFEILHTYEATNYFHRGLFSQILPKLPRTIHRDLVVIPRESHHQLRENAPLGLEHQMMFLAQYLHQQELLPASVVEETRLLASGTYTRDETLPPTPFPPVDQLQSFFGLQKKDVYRFRDKLHPNPKLIKGMEWKAKDESLMEWWHKHDKSSSYFSKPTAITKKLMASISQTSLENLSTLRDLLKQADEWLIAKEHSNTSRYYLVESFRNNLYFYLISQNVPKKELDQVNRNTLYAGHYFLKHWTAGSKAASWFKTDETRLLDKAFKEHDASGPSLDNDMKLMKALDAWCSKKLHSNSKRFDLVVGMKEHLQEVIDNCYAQSLDNADDFQKDSDSVGEDDFQEDSDSELTPTPSS